MSSVLSVLMPVISQWLIDPGCHQIDPGNIEPDNLSSLNSKPGDLRVHLIGNVLGGPPRAEVGVAAQQHPLAGLGHRVSRQPLLSQQRHGHRVEGHR